MPDVVATHYYWIKSLADQTIAVLDIPEGKALMANLASRTGADNETLFVRTRTLFGADVVLNPQFIGSITEITPDTVAANQDFNQTLKQAKKPDWE